MLQFLPPPTGFAAALINAEVGFVSSRAAAIKAPDTEIDAAQLSAHLAARYAGQVLTVGQEVAFEFQVRAQGEGARAGVLCQCGRRGSCLPAAAAGWAGARRVNAARRAQLTPPPACLPATWPTSPLVQGINYLLRVGTIMVADPSADQLAVHRAQLLPDTAYVYETRHGGGLKITGQRAVANTQVLLGRGGGLACCCCRPVWLGGAPCRLLQGSTYVRPDPAVPAHPNHTPHTTSILYCTAVQAQGVQL